jgi:hypothetical protein
VRSYKSGLTTLILAVCLLGTVFAAADDQGRSSTADSSFSGHDNERNTLADSACGISCCASGPDRDESGSGRPGTRNVEVWSERNALRILDERHEIARIRSSHRDCHVALNGIVDRLTSGVIALAYSQDRVWYENNPFIWKSTVSATVPANWSIEASRPPLQEHASRARRV